MKNPDTLQAMCLAFLTYMLWSCCDALSKGATAFHIPPYEMTMISGAVSSLLLFVTTLYRKRISFIKPQKKGLVFIRALVVVSISVLNYLAFARLPLANFYIVAFSAPLLVSVGAWLFLKEKLSKKKGFILLLGFLGVVVAVDPSAVFRGDIDGWGYLFCFSGAVAFAAAQLLLRKMSAKESPETLLLSCTLGQAVFGGLLTLLFYHPIDYRAALFLCASACLSLPANFIMIIAMKKASAATVSSLHYTQLIPGALFGYFIWGNTVSFNLIAGAAIIVVSGLAMAQYENAKRKRALDLPVIS